MVRQRWLWIAVPYGSASIRGSFESFGILNVPNSPLSAISMLFGVCEPSFGNKTERGSLAGAAYLLNINAGVLRRAQSGQKPDVAHKGKSSLDLRPSVMV